jgi:hypothetical protein
MSLVAVVCCVDKDPISFLGLGWYSCTFKNYRSCVPSRTRQPCFYGHCSFTGPDTIDAFQVRGAVVSC